MVKLSQSLEDYLEAILIINQKKKVVRVKDLMNYFDYKVSSVNNALNILVEKELIIHEKYGYIELTEKGKNAANKVYDRHKSITRFFINILGVDEKKASKDACSIEHHLHKETYESWYKLMKYIETTKTGKECLMGFKKILKSDKKK